MSVASKIHASTAQWLGFVRWSDWARGKVSLYFLILLLGVFLDDLGLRTFFLLAALVVLLALFGYAINNWSDRKEDVAVGKTNSFEKLSPRNALVFFGTVVGLIVMVSLAASRSFAVIALIAIQMVASFAYSHPPLRLKGRGFLGLLCVMFAQYVLPTVILMLNVQSATLIDWGVFTVFFLVNGLSLEIGHQCYDLERDRKVGLRTVPMSYTPASVSSAYKKLLSILRALIIALPLYLCARLFPTEEAFWFWCLYTLSMLLVLILLLAAIRRVIRWEKISFYDPYYHSTGNALDRLYTYFPNCFLPLYLTAILAVERDTGWLYLIFILGWVRLCMYDKPIRWHLREIRFLFLPPELFGL